MVHEVAIDAAITALELVGSDMILSQKVTTSMIGGVVSGIIGGSALSNPKHATLVSAAGGAALPYFTIGKAGMGEVVLSGVISTTVGYITNQLVHHNKSHADREAERRNELHGNRTALSMLDEPQGDHSR